MTYYYVLIFVILYRFLCTTVFKRKLQLMKNAVDWTRSLKDWAVATIKDSTPTLMYVLIIQAWKMVGLTCLTICFNSTHIDATYFSVSLFVDKKKRIEFKAFFWQFCELDLWLGSSMQKRYQLNWEKPHLNANRTPKSVQ